MDIGTSINNKIYRIFILNSIFATKTSQMSLPVPFLPLPRTPLSSHPFACQCEVSDGGGERISKTKEKRRKGGGKGKTKETVRIKRKREKDCDFAGWENLRGAWRPSTRI